MKATIPRFPQVALLLCVLLLAGCSTPASKEARFLQRGKDLLVNKDFSAASLEFRNAIQAMPQDAEPQYQLAVALLGMGDANGAITALLKTIELDPKHTEAQLRLASLMVINGNREVVEDAATRVESILSSSPANAAAMDLLALAEVRLGKVEEALRHMDEVLAKAPEDLAAAVNSSRIRLQTGDAAGAEAILKKLVEASPKSAPAALALAQLYFRTNRSSEGETYLRKALDLDPNHAEALSILAAWQLSHKQADQAEQTYRRLATLPGQDYKLAYAAFLFLAGRQAEGVTETEKVYKQAPNDRQVRGVLVSAYLRVGRGSEAEQIIADALKKNSRDTEALLQRADFRMRAGKLPEATEDLQTVLKLSPDSAVAHYALARIYGATGRPANQRNELVEVLQLSPGMLGARLDLATLNLRDSSASAALELLNQVPANQKSDTSYLEVRNRVLLALNGRAEVRKSIDSVPPEARTSELIYQDALLRLMQKDFAGGRQLLEGVLSKQPDHSAALQLLAISHLTVGGPAKALEVVEEYAGKAPNSAPMQTLRGMWLSRAGNNAKARAAFELAAKIDPNYTLAIVSLAEIDFSTDDLAGARRNAASVVAAHPEEVRARLILGLTEAKTGNRAAAIEQFREVVRIDAKNADGWNNLAYFLAPDNLNEALQSAQTALTLAPDNGAVLDTVGWLHYRKGNYTAAVNYLTQAFGKDASPLNEYHLGMAYDKAGEKVRGAQHVEAALKRDPHLDIGESTVEVR